MVKKLNELKSNVLLEEECTFFLEHKKIFIQSFGYIYKQHHNCEHCILDVQEVAEHFYEALFDNNADSFDKQLCCMSRFKINGEDPSFLYSELMNELIENFANQNLDATKILIKIKELLNISKKQQSFLRSLVKNDTSHLAEKRVFDISTNTAMRETNISYLRGLSLLGKKIKFFVHTQIGTSMSYASIEQIGNNSIVIRANSEQLTALKLNNSSFILKNLDDEKNFSVQAKILCAKDSTVILKNIKELTSMPLLSRKYPRATIIYSSLVHIANENEYISGNMLDISEGGIGVMSSEKSTFEKGQDIVAFVSYENPETNFKFSFEATGYVASIIGKKNAFRYGISLNLEQKEKELIQSIINS